MDDDIEYKSLYSEVFSPYNSLLSPGGIPIYFTNCINLVQNSDSNVMSAPEKKIPTLEEEVKAHTLKGAELVEKEIMVLVQSIRTKKDYVQLENIKNQLQKNKTLTPNSSSTTKYNTWFMVIFICLLLIIGYHYFVISVTPCAKSYCVIFRPRNYIPQIPPLDNIYNTFSQFIININNDLIDNETKMKLVQSTYLSFQNQVNEILHSLNHTVNMNNETLSNTTTTIVVTEYPYYHPCYFDTWSFLC